jgi:hypothetical protein
MYMETNGIADKGDIMETKATGETMDMFRAVSLK